MNETFIAAPFGNYIKPKGTIPVCGTFTLHPNGGNVLWSVLRTLRWNASSQGWTNNLGLPNPGLKKGLERHIYGEVLSIAEIERNDFKKLYNLIPERMGVELNLSCPNLGGKSLPWDSAESFARTKEKREWCICKVSPTVTPEDLEFLITKLGFTQIHSGLRWVERTNLNPLYVGDNKVDSGRVAGSDGDSGGRRKGFRRCV